MEAVEKTGSLDKAAADMNLSYCGALTILQESEERLGFALLEREVESASGGGSRLTSRAKMLMTRYKSFNDEIQEAIRSIYRKHSYFSDKPDR